MITRSKCGIVKPKKIYYLATRPIEESEPLTYRVAAKNPKWVQAMDEEFNALGTWNLVPQTPDQCILGCKWIFHLK